jgi:carboxypeptidase T
MYRGECFRTVPETYSALTNLAAAYPTLCRLTNAGTTFWGNTIVGIVLSSTNNPSSAKYPVMLTAGIHAAEYAPPELLTRFAEKMVADYATNGDARMILDWGEIHVIPVINVDSRLCADTNGVAMGWQLRKNRNDDSCGLTFGVQLNRNFPFYWSNPGYTSCETDYPGPSLASEAETQSMTNYMTKLFGYRRIADLTNVVSATNSGLFIDFHTMEGAIGYPWGMSSTASPNSASELACASKLAYYCAYGGTNYYIATNYSAIGLVTGTAFDFAYGKNGVCSLVWEIGSPSWINSDNCLNLTNQVLARDLPALIVAVRGACLPFVRFSGPEITSLTVDTNSTILSITATANDTLKTTGETNNTVSGVYTIDTPSWLGGQTNALSITTNSFGVCTLAGSVVLSGISSGSHIVFVEAFGANGSWGIPKSELFTNTLITSINSPTLRAGTLRMSQ